MRSGYQVFLSIACNLDGRGKYYPRVFFVNPDLTIDYDINNAGFSPMYHYYYYDATTLQDNMLRYLENHALYERDMTDLSDLEGDYEMELSTVCGKHAKRRGRLQWNVKGSTLTTNNQRITYIIRIIPKDEFLLQIRLRVETLNGSEITSNRRHQ